jgi:hypothetical protein
MPHEVRAFTGKWLISRLITDFRDGQSGRFIGEATFTPNSGTMSVYREEGRLELANGAILTADRTYFWQQSDLGIDVSFEDGRFFHRIAPGDCPTARHDCAPDIYDVRYDFSPWPRWQALWRVSGPRKDYEMKSIYTKNEG